MIAQHANDPAFPATETSGAKYGISLRDYFAAAALQGICAGGAKDVTAGTGTTSKGLALAAYQIADQMFQARDA